jgi:hypothetical protein
LGVVKRIAQWGVVWFLVNLCGVLDHIPTIRRGPNGKLRWTASQWGCWPFKLAYLSDKLDQRWHTGVWEPAPDTSPKE